MCTDLNNQNITRDNQRELIDVRLGQERSETLGGPNDLRTTKDALWANRCRAADIQFTSGTGVYALYLPDPHALSAIEVDSSGPLNVGMTEDSQDERNHFGHRDSSFSSPRRSLGAILKKDRELTAIPRGSGKSAKDMTCYIASPATANKE